MDRRAYDVSVIATTAKLKLSWSEALESGVDSALARNESLIHESAKVALPKIAKNISLDAALEALANADQGIVALADLERDAATTVAQLDKVTGICESREKFDGFGMGSIAEIMVSQIVVPKSDYNPSASANTNPYTMIGDFAGDFISRHRFNKQVKLANAAMASIPQKVIQPDAAFEISKFECKKSLNLRWQDIQLTQRAAGNLGDATRQKIRALLAVRQAAERKIIISGLDEAAKSSGYAKLLAEIKANNFRGNLDIGLVQANEELRVLRKATNQAAGCFERLKAMENYHDALAENQAVLKQLDGQAANDDLGLRVHALAKKVAVAKADFDAKQNLLSREACR
ncbi:MAG: hypothetical protein EOP11_16150 [Proteobacteria bacterium]|nr:MAG: hypothetical protein EOP11_16150 [Pseudomonadota bacterium]